MCNCGTRNSSTTKERLELEIEKIKVLISSTTDERLIKRFNLEIKSLTRLLNK